MGDINSTPIGIPAQSVGIGVIPMGSAKDSPAIPDWNNVKTVITAAKQKPSHPTAPVRNPIPRVLHPTAGGGKVVVKKTRSLY